MRVRFVPTQHKSYSGDTPRDLSSLEEYRNGSIHRWSPDVLDDYVACFLRTCLKFVRRVLRGLDFAAADGTT